MDYTTEVVNITKIKDGFFLGDEATAASLDVIIQFKITHMINAAGVQIINAWESIGIKYLTLNWSDNQSQNLFDQKDEIANKIVSFIDDTFKSGEGILVHSLKAQNRGCIVILIYLIKKYRWSLNKALEFLNNKKFDVEIPKYFLNQLSMFESRLSKVGMGPKTNTFNELSNENDLEEKVIHNTYLNGLNNKTETRSNIDIERKISSVSSKRICWADNNNFNRKDLLCNTNYTKDLFYQKDIKPILSHKKGKPIKSILKKRSASADGSATKYKMFSLNNVTASTNLNNSNINNQNAYSATSNYNSNLNNYGSNNSFIINNENKANNDNTTATNLSNNSIINNYVNNKNIASSISNKPLGQNNNYSNLNQTGMSNASSGLINNSSVGNNKENSNNNNSNLNSRLNNLNNQNPSAGPRQNYFNNNNQNSNNPQQRSYSLDQKNENNNNRNNQGNNNNYGSNNNQGEMTKIIITPNIHSIYNHNINNYYIQSANDINLEKLRENTTTPPSGSGINNMNFDSNNSYKINERPNSVSKKDPNSIAGSNNISPLNAQGNNFNYTNTSLLRSQNQLNANNLQNNFATNNNKLVKSLDNQRLLQNNFLNQNSFIDNKQMKVIDYKTGLGNNNSINSQQGYNIPQYNSNKNAFNQPQGLNNLNKILPFNNFVKPSTNSLNNYQPELNKKNFHEAQSHGIGLLNRPSSQMRQGPVKIQKNDYDRKPSTPDAVVNNFSSLKLGNSLNSTNKGLLNNANQNFNLGIGLSSNQPYGTIKRSNSNKKQDNSGPNDRPSTAPQKNDKLEERGLNPNGSMKRLPSPNVKSNNSLGNSSKNISTGINYAKYRSPSPSSVGKPSTIMMGSIKSAGIKAKWK